MFYVIAGSTKDNGIYSNLKVRQFVNNIIFFTLLGVTQKTKKFNNK